MNWNCQGECGADELVFLLYLQFAYILLAVGIVSEESLNQLLQSPLNMTDTNITLL